LLQRPSCPGRLGSVRLDSRPGHRLLADERGSITVEYTVLIVLVALGCAAAMVGLGVPLVRMSAEREIWLLLALP
jgi:Flp pilus assembly pilin Flp